MLWLRIRIRRADCRLWNWGVVWMGMYVGKGKVVNWMVYMLE